MPYSTFQTSYSVKIAQVEINTIFERKIVNILLPISFNIFLLLIRTVSLRDGSIEYPQNMFRLRNKIIFFLQTLNLRPEIVLLTK